MSYILLENQTFEETTFDNECDLEKAVIKNKKHIFGTDIIYIDYKRKVGAINSKNIGIPDGFLIDFSNPKKPQLFFVEYELVNHHLYDHIGPQIMRFYASFENENGKRDLQKKLINIFKDDKSLNKEIGVKIKNVPFDNLDSLLNYLLFERQLGIIIIIDEQTEDFNALLRRFSEVPEVIVIKKYLKNGKILYQYSPFREGITEKKHSKITKEVDTIVCPAMAEGFKHAFLDNDAWWAIRISPTLIPQLKYIAMYETKPISEVKWYAKIKQNGIQPYKNTGKYIVYLEDKKKITPIKLDEKSVGVAPQASRYTTFEKLRSAKKISDLW